MTPPDAEHPTDDAPAQPEATGAAADGFDAGLSWLTVLIMLIGTGIAGYASLMYWFGLAGVGCHAELQDACAVIHLPPLANPLGFLPIPVLGLVGYLAVLALEILWLVKRGMAGTWRHLQRGLILLGALISLGLIAFQWAATAQLCPVCLSSAIAFQIVLIMHLVAGDPVKGETEPASDRNGREEDFSAAPSRLNVWRSLAVFVILVPLFAFAGHEIGKGYDPFQPYRGGMINWIEQFPPVLTPHPRHPNRAQLVMVYDNDCPICAYFYGVTLQPGAFLDQVEDRGLAVFRCERTEQKEFYVSVPGLEPVGTPALVFLPPEGGGPPQIHPGWARLPDVIAWLDQAPKDARAGRGSMEDHLNVQRNVGPPPSNGPPPANEP